MTSATTPKTIELYGNGCQHEAEALAAITPGHLIERAAGGVQVHSTGGAGGNPHFALEYSYTGRGIDDAYADGDQVVFKTFYPGASVYALLEDGNNVSVGDFLISEGNGLLSLQAADSTAIVFAQALEAVNASGSDERIRVEVVAPFSVTLPA